MQEQLLNYLASYGVIVVFVAITLSAIGLPLPASFLLIAAGSLVESGDLSLWQVLVAGGFGAILGDHIGYGMGWFGGQTLVQRIVSRLNAQSLLTRAENTSRKWGGVSIFLSRWLITAVGPYINLTSGLTRYATPRFTFWVIVGELLWVFLYVQLGRWFSDRVAELSDILGDFTFVILGLAVVAILVYKLYQSTKNARADQTELHTSESA
jgi:membrane protein DedA with SNARE-associated domain